MFVFGSSRVHRAQQFHIEKPLAIHLYRTATTIHAIAAISCLSHLALVIAYSQNTSFKSCKCLEHMDSLLFVVQIWQMKQEEVHAVAHKLLSADRVIHEQQLGWQWRGPDEDALLAGPHSPQATRSLAGSRKKSASQKAGSEIAENEEMPEGQFIS